MGESAEAEVRRLEAEVERLRAELEHLHSLTEGDPRTIYYEAAGYRKALEEIAEGSDIASIMSIIAREALEAGR